MPERHMNIFLGKVVVSAIEETALICPPLLIFFRLPRDNGYVRDKEHLCDGWADVVGYHLDKVLMMFHKPPAVGMLSVCLVVA